MKPLRNNRIVVDLNKVQYAILNWVNQWGDRRDSRPLRTTVRGEAVDTKELALPHPNYPGEKLLARAYRLGLVDVWTPELILRLQANSSLIYTGPKALSICREWNSKIFKKKGKQ